MDKPSSEADVGLYLLGLGLFLALIPQTNIGQFFLFGPFGYFPALALGALLWVGWMLVSERTVNKPTTPSSTNPDWGDPADADGYHYDALDGSDGAIDDPHVVYYEDDKGNLIQDTDDKYHERGFKDYLRDLNGHDDGDY